MHGNFKLANPNALRDGGLAEPVSDTSFDIKRLWALFLRRWRIIGLVAGGVLALTVVWLLQATPVYTATTQVLIDPRKDRVLRGEGVVGDLTLDASTVATEVTLIQSFSIARRVSERLKLDRHPQFGGKQASFSLVSFLVSTFKSFVDFSQPTEEDELQAAKFDVMQGLSPQALKAIGMIQDGLTVRRVPPTYFIEVSYSHPDPKIAAQLANAIAEAYLVEQLEARYQAATRAANWLNERVTAVRAQLETAERALAQFKAENNVVSAQGGTIADQQAAAINNQLAAARADSVQKKTRFEQAQRIMESGAGIETIANLVDSQIIAGLRTQETTLARQEADLLTRYGPEHPSIVKSRAERGDIRRQIRAEMGRVVQAAKADYEFALEREKSLEASLEELLQQDARGEGPMIQLRELERQVQSNRLLYDTLLTRFKEAEQQTSLQTAESRIIAPAIPPEQPSFPRTGRFLLIAFVLGFGLGTGTAFLLEYLENGFVTIEQLEAALQIPVLSMVPQIKDRDRTVDGRVVPIPEFVALKPLSRYGEAIRSARVSAQMSSIDQPPRLMMITSAIPSEGKTTMTLSIAHSAASSGQRVLLMDCDLRHPSSSKYFNVHEGPGLTDLLMGSAPPERVFLRTGQTNLTILPAGTSTQHPPDILSSDRFRSLIGAARENYDLVLVDAPPLSPVIDASILARLVDKVIFVVQWRKTPRDVIERSLQGIDGPQRLAGVVLNNAQLGVVSTYAPYYSYYHKKYQKYYQQ
jgi:exopolysaccharide transport family protein